MISDIIARQGFLVLDGGLATTLEDRGHDLRDPLWSARVLLDDPGAIRDVHRAFLDAGADVIISASYQAGLPGLALRGLDAVEAAALLRRSVDLALEARDAFLASAAAAGRPRPLVAAGVGPYGATLADGSEYTGAYDLDAPGLRAFHAERWRILAATPADLLACETIPSLREAAVLLDLLEETPGRCAWISFSCRDGERISDGTPFAEAVRLCADHPRVAAVGVNCTAPRHVGALIAAARTVTDLPLLAYPNSGEEWDAVARAWRPGPEAADWTSDAPAWCDAGAQGIGGCCRVGPEAIMTIRQALTQRTPG